MLAIADTQRQLLDVEKARLEVELENVSLKKIKLLSKGVYQDDEGNWVCVKKSKEE